jgi:hypothetical protein
MNKEASNIYLFLLKILCNDEIDENSSYFSVTRKILRRVIKLKIFTLLNSKSEIRRIFYEHYED